MGTISFQTSPYETQFYKVEQGQDQPVPIDTNPPQLTKVPEQACSPSNYHTERHLITISNTPIIIEENRIEHIVLINTTPIHSCCVSGQPEGELCRYMVKIESNSPVHQLVQKHTLKVQVDISSDNMNTVNVKFVTLQTCCGDLPRAREYRNTWPGGLAGHCYEVKSADQLGNGCIEIKPEQGRSPEIYRVATNTQLKGFVNSYLLPTIVTDKVIMPCLLKPTAVNQVGPFNLLMGQMGMLNLNTNVVATDQMGMRMPSLLGMFNANAAPPPVKAQYSVSIQGPITSLANVKHSQAVDENLPKADKPTTAI
jgi:hypothetical protein